MTIKKLRFNKNKQVIIKKLLWKQLEKSKN
jgi:hypothetical protein